MLTLKEWLINNGQTDENFAIAGDFGRHLQRHMTCGALQYKENRCTTLVMGKLQRDSISDGTDWYIIFQSEDGAWRGSDFVVTSQ